MREWQRKQVEEDLTRAKEFDDELDWLYRRITGRRHMTQEERGVELDFTKWQDKGPFVKAKEGKHRLKVFIYGDTGSGKTTLALKFPLPVVIDMEGGTNLYGDDFDFGVFHTTSVDEAIKAVEWLRTHKHGYRTLVVDPVTIFWEALQKKWSDIFKTRKEGTKGYKHEFYEMQPRDWMTLKSELREFTRHLTALDMNVVCTARVKAQYAEGAMMQKVGETFDGEKSLPYLFDIVVRLYAEDGKHLCEVIKDRSNRLPRALFEPSWEVFEAIFGKEEISREAKVTKLADPMQCEDIRRLAAEYGLTYGQMKGRLKNYEADEIEDLTHEQAAGIIKRLKKAIEKEKAANNGEAS